MSNDLIIEKISLRNFLSYGNITHTITIDKDPITLIMGVNLDKADNNGDRNGTGKSTIGAAIIYGLYGKSTGNKIKVNNLINKINKNNMEVTIWFSKNDKKYRIERGKKPDYLRFYIDDGLLEVNEAQGENIKTQREINNIIGISREVFEQLVLLTAQSIPFLSQTNSKQKLIVEEILGITQLSNKANVLKEHIKQSKNLIEQEEIKINTLKISNQTIEDNHKRQIEQLYNNYESWSNKHNSTIAEYENTLSQLEKIDIEQEINNHKIIVQNNEQRKINTQIEQLYNNYESWSNKHNSTIAEYENTLSQLEKIDIEQEINNHKIIVQNNEQRKINAQIRMDIANLKKSLSNITNNKEKISQKLLSIQNQIISLEKNICPTCNQKIENSSEIMFKFENEINNIIVEDSDCDLNIKKLNEQISELESKIQIENPNPTTHYKTIDEAYQHKTNIDIIKGKLVDIKNEVNPYQNQINEIGDIKNIDSDPIIIYKTIDEAYQHKTNIDIIKGKLVDIKNEVNPYQNQINEIGDAPINIISYEKLNEIVLLKEHQEFLLKILSSKDSFVRKKIIDTNIAYLNERLTYYLENLGMLHYVKFNNDLSVDIEKYGQLYDYGNLSRGEETRVNLALSWSFRDLWEMLNNKCNLMFIDELIDNGLDPSGLESVLNIIERMSKQHDKNIIIVSHREELINRVSNVLTVIMSGGFSSLET